MEYTITIDAGAAAGHARAACHNTVRGNKETMMSNMTKAQEKKLSEMTTKSGKIRYLAALGWDRGAIAKHLQIKYQHVRNVLITPVNKPKES